LSKYRIFLKNCPQNTPCKTTIWLHFTPAALAPESPASNAERLCGLTPLMPPGDKASERRLLSESALTALLVCSLLKAEETGEIFPPPIALVVFAIAAGCSSSTSTEFVAEFVWSKPGKEKFNPCWMPVGEFASDIEPAVIKLWFTLGPF
jgi:hypothetical protein